MNINRECDNCGGAEERVFTDSWTGQALCLGCLAPIAMQVTNSPASEGDNLPSLLEERYPCDACGALVTDEEYEHAHAHAFGPCPPVPEDAP